MVLSLLRVRASQERYGGYWLVLQGLSRSLTACVSARHSGWRFLMVEGVHGSREVEVKV